MGVSKEKRQIKFGETIEVLDGRFYVGAKSLRDGNGEIFKVTGGKDGLGVDTVEIHLGGAHTFLFQNPYEVRVLSATTSYVTIQVCELPVIDTAKEVFQSSKIFNDAKPSDKFSAYEIGILKTQLSDLEARINYLHNLTESEAKYVKSSFELLNEKLDTSTKEGWRQTAYGILVSVGLSISIDFDKAVNFYIMAENYLSSATNLLIGKS